MGGRELVSWAKIHSVGCGVENLIFLGASRLNQFIQLTYPTENPAYETKLKIYAVIYVF